MNRFENVMIIGLGLIGGSIGLALKKAGYKGTVIGFDIAVDNLINALKAQAIDTAAKTLREALNLCGLVVIAAPLGSYEKLFRQIAEIVPDKQLVITDVGSVKQSVQYLAEKHLPRTVTFLGGHPMTGSEKSGFSAATAQLFEDAYYFLTPTKEQDQESTLAVEAFVRCIGARPVIVTPWEHDKIAAHISHVPHLVAAMLANTLDMEGNAGHAVFSGGGFRDTTRIASGNPYLWKDILIYNKKEILSSLETIENSLSAIKKLLKNEDEASLLNFLQKAKFIRDSLPKNKEPDFPSLSSVFIKVEENTEMSSKLTQLIMEYQINIRDIEIMYPRNATKVIHLVFQNDNEKFYAQKILMKYNFVLINA